MGGIQLNLKSQYLPQCFFIIVRKLIFFFYLQDVDEFIQTTVLQRDKSDSRTDKKTTPKSNGKSPLRSDGKSTDEAGKSTKQSNVDTSTACEQDKDQLSMETFSPLKNVMSMFH